jgi:hypothetical protein
MIYRGRQWRILPTDPLPNQAENQSKVRSFHGEIAKMQYDWMEIEPESGVISGRPG